MPAALLFFQASTPQSNPLVGTFLLPAAMFAIMYFILIRPMQRQRKKAEEMLGSLKNGDTVQTSGGIIGSIVSLQDDTLVLRVKPDNVKLTVARSAISSVVTPPESK